jgi:gamma-glutamyltranspeptidase/glutathione hydrolase
MTQGGFPIEVHGTTALPGVAAPRRGPAFGRRYAIATDHYLASQVGMDVLKSGGNAIDAAIAASAVNVVTKPHQTHLGGDAFVQIWHRETGVIECLNAGGRASRNADPERFREMMPQRGPAASTVPGLVDAWSELHKRHGSRHLDELLAPAIDLADNGFPVSMKLSGAIEALSEWPAVDYEEELRRLFLINGRTPYQPGQTLRQQELADTLSRIATDGRDGFYRGGVGRAIVRAMADGGGLIDAADLTQPAAHWHESLSTTFEGATVSEQALPSQGIILLIALNIVERFPLADWGLVSADSVHVMVEAVRLAFADVRRFAADPLVETVPTDVLLSKEHAARRAAEIDLARAKTHPASSLETDTTSFVVADETMAVTFIQSVYAGWGSHFAVPGTGVVMNNRMRGFHTDPASPNRLAPGKRTVHTLNTYLVTRDGELLIGGGTPGADYQVQCNLQTIVGRLVHGLDLQSAVDAPRWVVFGNGRLGMEARFAPETVANLRARGHDIELVAPWEGTLCRSQAVASLPGGGWAAASDLRGEGVALAY